MKLSDSILGAVLVALAAMTTLSTVVAAERGVSSSSSVDDVPFEDVLEELPDACDVNDVDGTPEWNHLKKDDKDKKVRQHTTTSSIPRLIVGETNDPFGGWI